MSTAKQLSSDLQQRFADQLLHCALDQHTGEITVVLAADQAITVLRALRDEPLFAFSQLSDLCGVDYLTYGLDEWKTDQATGNGFSRGVTQNIAYDDTATDQVEGHWPGSRFAVVYHLLSVEKNHRLRVRVETKGQPPQVDSVIALWPSANWYEREAFDLFGILFDGHPDLRRILTDYGFVGHAFRKDFPLSGHLEVRYDSQQKRVIYQPVSIEPRVLVPRVIRDDHRYLGDESV